MQRVNILDRNLLIVFAITLMVIMGVSSVMPVLPTLMEVFDTDPAGVSWVVTAFALPGIFMAPLAGILADRVGRRRILVPCLFLFGAAGFACVFATSLPVLVGLRFLQGMGAAPLGVLNLTLLGDLYSDAQRATVMGYNASVLSVGTALFPALGGVMAWMGWWGPFLLPLISLVMGVVVLTWLDSPEPKSSEGLSSYLKGALSTLITRKALGLLSLTFLIFIILYGCFITYLPILLDFTFQAGPAAIGLILSTASALTALASSQLGRLSERFRPSTIMVGACFFYAISLLLTPRMGVMWHMILPMALFGLAQGLMIPSVMTLLTGLAPLERRAGVMSAYGMILRLGQTVAPVLMSLVFAGFGLGGVYLAGTGVAGIMLVVVLSTVRPGGHGRG